MNIFIILGKKGKMLVSAALAIIVILSTSVVFGQTNEKPKKPDINNPNGFYEVENLTGSEILMPVPNSTDLSTEMGYWSHLTTQNTGGLPFGESLFYAYPRYWNYVFVDSNNRLFTDAGGLFVWNGAYWRAVTANGEQISRVREIVEDTNGNLWLGTIDGLIQLNSALQYIDKYTTGNSNLKKNDINTLWIEDDGSLWVGHRWDEHTGGGVTIFNEQVIDSLDGYTNDIIQRSNGDVWVAQAPDDQGNGGSIYVYRPSNDSSWIYTEDNSGLPHSEIDNFSEDNQGNVWMGHYATPHHPMGGITKFDGSNWTYYDQNDGLPQGGAWYTYAASDDKVYYTTGDSVMIYENDSWNHFTNNNDRFPLKGSTIITEDQDDNLVIGADPGADGTGGGIHIYDGSTWEFMSSHTDGGLFSNVIFGADTDTEGNLWFSGFYGATMYDGENWTYFNEHDGISDSYPWKLLAASDGSIWFGVGEEVTRYQDGEFITYDHTDYAEAIFEDSEGNIWFGAWNWVNANNEGGILQYDGSGFTVFDDTDGIMGNHVTAFGEDPDGNIYAATDVGVLVYDGSGWSEFAVDGQTGVGANELASDANNNLWIDTNGAIKKWDGTNWTTYDNSDGYMGWTTHIEPASDGSIWMAGARVQVIRDGTLVDVTPNAEYPGTTSYVITHDDQGQTWVGTYGNGLFKYDMSEGLVIESIEDYPEDQGGWVTLTTGGFMMDEYNIQDPGYSPSSWVVQRKNGEKWESAGTSFEFSGQANQISVQVPTTMPSDEDLGEHKYDFRVGIYDNAGEVLGYSDVVTAYAVDNLAPEAVNGVDAQRGTDAVTLSWSPSEANDLAGYEIYEAGAVDSEPLATSQQNSVTLSDADYSGVQEIIVRARDRHKNIGSSSESAIAVFPIDLVYEVPNEEQWQLIGLPLDADASDVENLRSQIKEGTLYTYDGSYQSVETLEPGHGYWAKFDASGDYQVPGVPLVEQTLDLNEGWNLISGVGAALGYEQIQDPNGILIEGTLSAFDQGYMETEALNPGGGYWLRASEEGTVTLSLLSETATIAPKKKSALVEAKDKLNKVFIRSATGVEQTLYFGEEQPRHVDLRSFSLPPKAPGNTFDVRFADNSRFIETSDELVINIEPGTRNTITLSLDLAATHPHQEYMVQELKDREVLAEHTLTAENSITLQNSQITSLKMIPSGMKQVQADVPNEFDLAPSYPNPFNPSTTIQYQLPQQEAVHLDVFNMAGRKVRTLVAGEQQEAGTHTLRFDASTLSSGMYFVRMQAGSFQKIQKITLIK